MKNKFLISSFLFILFSVQLAFSQARETTAKLLDADHPAFTDSYSFPSDIVTGAIRQRLKQDGITSRMKKNIISSEGVNYPTLASETIDLYFQVKGLGRRGRDGSVVTMFISKGKDNFTGNTNDTAIARNAIQYLNNLQHDISLYSLQQQIKDQQKLIDSKAKEYSKLLKDSKKMQGKRYSLQRSLSGETDPAKQDKLKRKVEKLDRNISNKQTDITNCQNQLQQLKGQLNLLQEQLNQQMSKGK